MIENETTFYLNLSHFITMPITYVLDYGKNENFTQQNLKILKPMPSLFRLVGMMEHTPLVVLAQHLLSKQDL